MQVVWVLGPLPVWERVWPKVEFCKQRRPECGREYGARLRGSEGYCDDWCKGFGLGKVPAFEGMAEYEEAVGEGHGVRIGMCMYFRVVTVSYSRS